MTATFGHLLGKCALFLSSRVCSAGGVFIVIFVGIGLAIITLIFEYWYYKYRKPSMAVDSAQDRKLQVKQAAAGGAFADKSQYQADYR